MAEEKKKMERYLFNAQAVALQGSIRKPQHHELGDHLAISTNDHTAGRREASSHGFVWGEHVCYNSALTTIDAVENGTSYETTLIAQIEGLRIGRLTADRVICQLRSVFDSSEYPGRCRPRISPAGSTIENLCIDGKVQTLNLPPAFSAGGSSRAFFAGQHDNDPTLHPGDFPSEIRVPGFGTIYYAEWSWVYPEKHEQRLTMLRLALGSNLGAHIDVGICHSDGTGWPPTGP